MVSQYVPTLPQTIDEAVNGMLLFLSQFAKRTLKRLPESDLTSIHMAIGLDIRTRFALWQGNTALLRACGSESMHPDDASMVIVHALWERLQKKQE